VTPPAPKTAPKGAPRIRFEVRSRRLRRPDGGRPGTYTHMDVYTDNGHCGSLAMSDDEAAELRRRLDAHEGQLSQFFYDMAKYAARRWDEDVRDRPKVNIYRAGMDKAWKTLERYCLEQREAIDTALHAAEPQEVES